MTCVRRGMHHPEHASKTPIPVNYQFQFDAVFAAWPLLLKGTWITIQLSLVATALGLVVAIFCAWGKVSGPKWLRFIVNAYIEVIRNTPFLVQLFFFFFALPAVGLRWSPYTAALTAMVVNLGAYAAEIVRAGIESIPKGQIEAGRALNLKPWEIFRFVIIKPALKQWDLEYATAEERAIAAEQNQRAGWEDWARQPVAA